MAPPSSLRAVGGAVRDGLGPAVVGLAVLLGLTVLLGLASASGVASALLADALAVGFLADGVAVGSGCGGMAGPSSTSTVVPPIRSWPIHRASLLASRSAWSALVLAST